MRINTLFYTLRQGFRNIFRNKWFTLASIATISACLFLFGLFYAIVTGKLLRFRLILARQPHDCQNTWHIFLNLFIGFL